MLKQKLSQLPILFFHYYELAILILKLIFFQLNMKWTTVLNPLKTPVDVSDHPACAITKGLQFCQPDISSQYFSIFIQFHIEQSLLVVNEQLIEGSGLVEILTENNSP